ncbi:hypothetical protein AS030_01130 [Fictibacillus enclensis]|uniref:Uncharacterized protein n=1 Tax=Fictibacillus enclensis TaxID=1017270 RepID=A0A0V8JAG7_9BACL|nr:hypothetical protein AS030_01130 [Fictibacillus enclensis]
MGGKRIKKEELTLVYAPLFLTSRRRSAEYPSGKDQIKKKRERTLNQPPQGPKPIAVSPFSAIKEEEGTLAQQNENQQDE